MATERSAQQREPLDVNGGGNAALGFPLRRASAAATLGGWRNRRVLAPHEQQGDKNS